MESIDIISEPTSIHDTEPEGMGYLYPPTSDIAHAADTTKPEGMGYLYPPISDIAPVCTGTTLTGARCRRVPKPGTDTCAHHSGTKVLCRAIASKGHRCRQTPRAGAVLCAYHAESAPIAM